MNCKWVSDPSDIIIQGYKIERGFFYLGETFPVYKNKRLNGDIGRKKNVRLIKEPVIDPTLPISDVKTRKRAVVSYADMDGYQRYLYLKWLSGEGNVTNTPAAIILYYLWVISIRVFCDNDCTEKEVNIISKHISQLKSECAGKDFIANKISMLQSYICLKYYPKNRRKYKCFEHIQQDLAIEKFASSHMNNLEDAYDILFDCFPKDNKLSKFDESVKKEWWNIACDIVKSSNSGQPLFPTVIKFDNREFSLDSCFSPVHTFLDFTIVKYSKEEAMSYTLLFRCNDEFQICHRRHQSGLPARRKCCIRNKQEVKKDKDIEKTRISNMIDISPVNDFVRQNATSLKSKLQYDYQFMTVSDIMITLGFTNSNNASLMSRFKEFYQDILSEGIGIAPSPSSTKKALKRDDSVVIFQRTVQEKCEPDYQYDCVDIFLKLAAYISQGKVTDRERSYVKKFITTKDNRSGNQKQLYACFLWYLVNFKNIGLEIEESINNDLNAKGREFVAKHLLEYVEYDLETLFAKERLLVNVLPLLTSKPYTVSDEKRSEALVTIDNSKLGRIKHDTLVAQSFLSEIFVDIEEHVETPKSSSFEQRELLSVILSKSVWTRDELNDLCRKRSCILGSMLEMINDYSYSKVNDLVIEDEGETLYVNLEYKNELL